MQNLQGYGHEKKTVTCRLESYVSVDILQTIEVFDGNFAVGVVLMRTAGRLLIVGIKMIDKKIHTILQIQRPTHGCTLLDLRN